MTDAEYNSLVRRRKGRAAGFVPCERPEDAARDEQREREKDHTMTDEEKLKHCRGCHDDFYNQPGNSAEGRCWMLGGMKLIMRKEVSIDQRPPWNQKARLFPACYHRQRFVYVQPEQTY